MTSLQDLLEEQWYLVKHIGISYEATENMLRKERHWWIKRLIQDFKDQQKAMKKYR